MPIKIRKTKKAKLKDFKAACSSCDKKHLLEEFNVGEEDELLCSTCYTTVYTSCNSCSQTVRLGEDQTDPDGYSICQTCYDENYTDCNNCEETSHRNDMHTMYDETMVCESCADESFCCSRCSRRFWDGDRMTSEDNGEDYCESCYTSRRRSNRIVHDYSYKPEPKFKKLKNEKVRGYTGLELELEIEDGSSKGYEDLAKEALAILGSAVYLKSDASIRNGFEVVTEPMSYNYILKYELL